ncbi:coiled-coil domain-containing protein 106-like [Seriola aureovittata]|uniref:coiled-coil domain-containing protein 106-like n=1 Tax=Seriola aureovittata TaxID=2871759 RepID=UPI0024BDCDC0|nr:coiled-coil domain-containing protein 106-like [Seriola aureovittata]
MKTPVPFFLIHLKSYRLKSPPSSSSSREVKPTDEPMRRRRARNTRSIVARYKMAMDAFNRGVLMKAAFETVGADRNTVSRTAPIAEISIAAPEIFRNVGAWDERKEKLSTFIERCHSAMTPEVKEKILKMKQEGTLLPIATQV